VSDRRDRGGTAAGSRHRSRSPANSARRGGRRPRRTASPRAGESEGRRLLRAPSPAGRRVGARVPWRHGPARRSRRPTRKMGGSLDRAHGGHAGRWRLAARPTGSRTGHRSRDRDVERPTRCHHREPRAPRSPRSRRIPRTARLLRPVHTRAPQPLTAGPGHSALSRATGSPKLTLGVTALGSLVGSGFGRDAKREHSTRRLARSRFAD
jgi:hypothetical protein